MTQRPVLLPQWPDQVRFWRHVEIGDCWEWQGSGDAPYGLFGYHKELPLLCIASPG